MKVRALVLALLASSGTLTEAQSGATVDQSLRSVRLEALVVDAEGEQPLFIQQPVAIQRLGANQLHSVSARNLPEALADLPGVMVQKTANGHGSPFIRGFTGYRVLSMIDGVRYNNSVYRDGPNEYFSLIDQYSIESLDLIGGPASALYGSDAVGGVIYLDTLSANWQQQTAGESFVSWQQNLRYASAERSRVANGRVSWGRGQQWGALLSVTGRDYGDVVGAEVGTQRHTGYSEQSVHLRLDRAFNDHWQSTVVHQQLAQDDVWRTHSTRFAEPFAGTLAGDDQVRLKDQYRDLTYLKLTGRRLAAGIDQLMVTLSRQHWDEDGDRVRADSRRIQESFDSVMHGIDVQLNRQLARGELVTGFDYYVDRVDSKRLDFAADGSLSAVAVQGPVGDDSRLAQGGLFWQYSHFLDDRTELQLGGRYHFSTLDIGRFADPQNGLPRSYHDRWRGWVNSVRLYRELTPGWAFWSGISQAFRAPNVADVSRSGRSRSSEIEVAALGLEPERFISYELGLKQASRNGSAGITLFHTGIDDFIASTPTGRVVDGLTEVTKRNAAAGRVRGVELSLRQRFTPAWSVSAALTWQQGELDSFDSLTSPAGSREPMSRIMPLTLSAGVRWQPRGNGWLGLALRVADRADKLSPGDLADDQRIPPGGTPGYMLVNLSGGYRLSRNVSFTLALNNLFDEAYRNHGSGVNEPGFGVTAGLQLTW